MLTYVEMKAIVREMVYRADGRYDIVHIWDNPALHGWTVSLSDRLLARALVIVAPPDAGLSGAFALPPDTLEGLLPPAPEAWLTLREVMECLAVVEDLLWLRLRRISRGRWGWYRLTLVTDTGREIDVVSVDAFERLLVACDA